MSALLPLVLPPLFHLVRTLSLSLTLVLSPNIAHTPSPPPPPPSPAQLGKTPLMYSVLAGNMAIFTFLLHDARTEAEAKCSAGRSALSLAQTACSFDSAATREWRKAAAGILQQHLRGDARVGLPPLAAATYAFFAAARDGDTACIERLTAEHKVCVRRARVYMKPCCAVALAFSPPLSALAPSSRILLPLPPDPTRPTGPPRIHRNDQLAQP